MKIVFKYFGLSTVGISKGPQDMILPDEAIVADVIEQLCQMVGEKHRELLESSIILVNHRQARHETPLNEDDEVMMMHVLGGG